MALIKTFPPSLEVQVAVLEGTTLVVPLQEHQAMRVVIPLWKDSQAETV